MTQTHTWQRVRLHRGARVVSVAELRAEPGKCAACRRPFNRHGDEELAACAAVYEETQPSGVER